MLVIWFFFSNNIKIIISTCTNIINMCSTVRQLLIAVISNFDFVITTDK